jgi:ABC-type lipoprotein release transport system permease subunit
MICLLPDDEDCRKSSYSDEKINTMNLSLAWRNVWRNKMRSMIIAASVAIGLFAGLFVLGLYEGMMRARVRTVIDSEVAHLQIHHPDFKNDYDPSLTLSPLRR